jgi:hypothetical protein
MAQGRLGTRRKKFALGRLGEISLANATARAKELMLAGGNGRDIVAEQRKASKTGMTLGHAFAEYTSALKGKGLVARHLVSALPVQTCGPRTVVVRRPKSAR